MGLLISFTELTVAMDLSRPVGLDFCRMGGTLSGAASWYDPAFLSWLASVCSRDVCSSHIEDQGWKVLFSTLFICCTEFIVILGFERPREILDIGLLLRNKTRIWYKQLRSAVIDLSVSNCLICLDHNLILLRQNLCSSIAWHYYWTYGRFRPGNDVPRYCW